MPAACSSILLLDAKHFRIQHHPWTLYVAWDGLRHQPLRWILLPRHELRHGYDRLLRALRTRNMRIDAVVSDWHPGILAAVAQHCPHAIHQRCGAHILREVYRVLGGRWWHRTGLGKQDWPIFRRIVLGFSSEPGGRRYLERMTKTYPQYHKAFRMLRNTLADVYQFARRSDLRIPRTSNGIENVMGRLEQRLKTMRGLKTPQTLERCITSLMLLQIGKPTNR